MKKQAFTLIELLVVIVIIGILAGLIMSASVGAIATAHRARCAANLSGIFRGYSAWKRDEPEDTMRSYLRAEGWAGVMLSYCRNNSRIFKCPSDKRPTPHFGGVAGLGLQLGRGNIRALVQFAPGGYVENSNQISGNEGNSPAYWKSTAGVDIRDIRQATNVMHHSVVVYDQGSAKMADKTEWTLVLIQPEGSQGDFMDAKIKFSSITDPGTATLLRGGVDGGNGLPSIVLFDGTGDDVISTNQLPGQISSYAGVCMKLDQPWPVGMVRHCSYAMTDFDQHIRHQSRILMLDFTNNMVRASLATNAGAWATWTVTNEFARHRSKLNVLFADGEVKGMTPAEVDPGIVENYTGKWYVEPE